jgi:hypothetical protein
MIERNFYIHKEIDETKIKICKETIMNKFDIGITSSSN